MLNRIIYILYIGFFLAICIAFSGFNHTGSSLPPDYAHLYSDRIAALGTTLSDLRMKIDKVDWSDPKTSEQIIASIHSSRQVLKTCDFWLRYLDPIAYRKINGPLPVEWENEVFEKFETPYRREGAGLILAENRLGEDSLQKTDLIALLDSALASIPAFLTDSMISELNNPANFYFANRLFLLNLTAIYTTGFECPDSAQILFELKHMLHETAEIYNTFNLSYPKYSISQNYSTLYSGLIGFVEHQTSGFSNFNHYTFIKDYVNPLFGFNQLAIQKNNFRSKNYNDYSLNNKALSIFNKKLYTAQDIKGIFRPVENDSLLDEIRGLGKLLFFDPLLSGNNRRSCASCHIPQQYFTDTSRQTALQFDERNSLGRNTPTLVNAVHHHLMMLDGKHHTLLNQFKDVISKPNEMNSDPDELMKKIMSCKSYSVKIKSLAKFTSSKKPTLDHVASAVVLYYSQFSFAEAPFDQSINASIPITSDAIKGFNLFMGKAQCATCHFPPQFNGIKPPYISSEFEVIGVPADTNFLKLSQDSGRFSVHPASEMLHAFRTGNLRNTSHTEPYMHNGVFRTMEEVIDFYDAGGGQGKGIKVSNQTLVSDSLHLSVTEKKQLLEFLRSLDEKIQPGDPPKELPLSSVKALNKRKVGGEY
ncbi:MAG: cytochrome C peroxidase [Saprospiraceae bacterium]|nr:cytochrome C peroxidase [Candidatus Vicinibacter affinis]